jgi:hypothetical protein
VRDELGWTGESQAYDAILAQLQPVDGGVAMLPARREPPPEPSFWTSSRVRNLVRGAHGKSFYALFDEYVPEVPVVDF